jgi:hypothetical protein
MLRSEYYDVNITARTLLRHRSMPFGSIEHRDKASEKACVRSENARIRCPYAEYTAVPPAAKMEPLAGIPDGVTDEQAAALPVAALTARDTWPSTPTAFRFSRRQ